MSTNESPFVNFATRMRAVYENYASGLKEYTNGDKEWFLNGVLHRVDGPAIEYTNGDKCWYLNGKLHREDGPAIEFASGEKRWYLNGRPAVANLSQEEKSIFSDIFPLGIN